MSSSPKHPISLDHLPDDALLTLKNTADYLDVAGRTLERWDREGRLKARRLSKRTKRYVVRDVKRFRDRAT